MPVDYYLKLDGVMGESAQPGQNGSDLLNVNNGDGSDFLVGGADDTFVFTEGETGSSGAAAEDAFFVKCDSSTTTQSEGEEAEDLGVVDLAAVEVARVSETQDDLMM